MLSLSGIVTFNTPLLLPSTASIHAHERGYEIEPNWSAISIENKDCRAQLNKIYKPCMLSLKVASKGRGPWVTQQVFKHRPHSYEAEDYVTRMSIRHTSTFVLTSPFLLPFLLSFLRTCDVPHLLRP